MAKVKTASSRQVVIPKKYWDILHLRAGDLFDVQLDKEKRALIFTQQDMVNKTEVERRNWITELVQAAKDNPVNIAEDEIVADKNIKEQIFKEEYGDFGKKKN